MATFVLGSSSKCIHRGYTVTLGNNKAVAVSLHQVTNDGRREERATLELYTGLIWLPAAPHIVVPFLAFCICLVLVSRAT